MEGRTEPVDQEYIRSYWQANWGLPVVSTRRSYLPEDVQGLVYRDEWGEPQGLVTWHIDGDHAEIVSVDAYQQGRHIGGRLLHAAEAELHKRGVRQLMIVTTNDNLRALGFSVRHGYRLTRIDADGMERVRKLKTDVPLLGHEGIPLRDMLELEKELEPAPAGRSMPRELRPESFS
ncbi:MAG: GNAT family N-acetyltransferase [Chloroflexota bacterium]